MLHGLVLVELRMKNLDCANMIIIIHPYKKCFKILYNKLKNIYIKGFCFTKKHLDD